MRISSGFYPHESQNIVLCIATNELIQAKSNVVGDFTFM